MIIDKPKKISYFILASQLISTIVSIIFFIQLKDDFLSIVNLVVQILLFFCYAFYFILTKNKYTIRIHTLFIFLFSYIISFSFGCALVLVDDNLFLTSFISSIFGLSTLVLLIYLSLLIINSYSDFKIINLSILKVVLFIYIVAILFLFNNGFNTFYFVIILGLATFFVVLLFTACYFVCKKQSIKNGLKIFIIFCPILCLYLNNVVLDNFFGDFSDKWFYIFALLNALLFLVDIQKIKFKLIAYFFKTICLAYVSYFAIVFLMYLPFAFVGIMFFGLGVLIFVPYFLFVMQFKNMIIEFKIISLYYKKAQIIITIIFALLTIPTILLINFNLDKTNYNNATTYLDNKTVQKDVDVNRLKYTIKKFNTVRDFNIFSTYETLSHSYETPIFSFLYKKAVLDKLNFDMLTNYKLAKIFAPEENSYRILDNIHDNMNDIDYTNYIDSINNNSFTVDAYLSDTQYDSNTGIYKSWINLNIKSNNKYKDEFITRFNLPIGCFITDYYLYVGDEKKQGFITYKKIANSVYNNIVSLKKDPGIINYISDDMIELKIFPFADDEIRKSGFQVMYTKDESLTIHNNTIQLKTENTDNKPIVFDNVAFIPSSYKTTLPKYNRTPEYHFLIDVSDAKKYTKNIYTTKKYIENLNILNPKYYAVSYDAKEINNLDDKIPVKQLGGFNYPLAIKKSIANIDNTKAFPIFIFVSDKTKHGLDMSLVNVFNEFPETNYFYILNSNTELNSYDLINIDYSHINKPIVKNVYNYDGFAIKDDDSNEIVYKNFNIDIYSDNMFENALMLNKKSFFSNTSKDKINSIKDSIKFRILNKDTSFIVLETKIQEEELLNLQKKYLDEGFLERIPIMSESNLIVVLFLICFIVFLNTKSKSKKL